MGVNNFHKTTIRELALYVFSPFIVSVTKHENNDESIIKTGPMPFDGIEDEKVKHDSSLVEKMDTEELDTSLSLSQSSNFGRSNMFKNNSLLLGKMIRLFSYLNVS